MDIFISMLNMWTRKQNDRETVDNSMGQVSLAAEEMETQQISSYQELNNYYI